MKVLRFKFIENCDSKYYGVSTLVNFQSPGIINNPFSFCYKVWLIYTKKNEYSTNYSYLTQNVSKKVVWEVWLGDL